MSTIALILAAGEQKRWVMDEPPHYKQLLDVGGEQIIKRIERQVIERGFWPKRITHHKALKTPWSYAPEHRRWTVETLLSAHGTWQERTIVLLGDTIYSRATMNRIFAQQSEELKVYGNQHEIYALVMIDPATWAVDVLNKAVAHAELGVARGGGKLRKFYQAYCGLNMTGNERESKVLQWVDDYTRDVDWPRDYEALLREVVETGRLDDLPEVKE